MADKPNTQIIIRHTAGAKVNRIDPFALADTNEISFGREASSTIIFDSPRDDVVSRRHAVLRVKSREPLSITLEDLKSSNGTFVNGERISGEVEILPEDNVEFGKGGPQFAFDLQPRPDNLQARTRAMSVVDATATRAVATTALTEAAPQTAQMPAAPVKTGVGKNTVMMMLSNERKRTGQRWMGVMAAAIAFILVVGGVVVFFLRQEAEVQVAKATEQAQVAVQQATAVTQQIGLTPGEIVNKFGNSTVLLNVQWRLYDRETGRPVYHKAWAPKGSKELLPAYLKFGDDIYPWLTTEDEEHKNYEVRGASSGSGFVVNEQGFILTNRHLGASWKESVNLTDYMPNARLTSKTVLFSKGAKDRCVVEQVVEYRDLRLKTWVPEDDGGFLFPAEPAGKAWCRDLPKFAKNESAKPFFGKNEILTVRFPGNRLSINADLVRTSTDEDIALLKVNSPEALVPLALASDDNVRVGERVMALGYPALSMSTFVTTENDRTGRRRREDIPNPTVTDGIVQKLGMQTTQDGTRRIESSQGDTLQVSVQAAPGASGGPVFNAEGKVIGLITYRRQDLDGSGVAFTYAVRIRHGRNLLRPTQNMGR